MANRARAAITRHLVVRHGFTIVAVEADWPDAAVIDRYVRDRAPITRSERAFRMALRIAARVESQSIRRLLFRTLVNRHVAQIYANSCPRGGSSSHGVHKHVIRSQKFRCFSMPALPSFQTCQRSFLVWRIRNGNERHLYSGRLRGA